MITGAIKSQVDKVWDAFWSGGISNRLRSLSRSPTCSSCGGWMTCKS
jgi:hypothetical protein